MARPRTASKVLDLRGSFKKHPERKAERGNEPEPTRGIGRVPAHLDEPEKKAWRELVKICHDGVLCDADRIHLEITARLLAYVRDLTSIELVSHKNNPLLRLESMLGKLGMTPSDRSRVEIDKPKGKGEFDDF